LHLFIPKGFKSNEFVRADSKGFAGAFFASAHPKGVTGFRKHQSIAPPESREALIAAALSLVCSFRVARSSHFSRDGAGEILRWAQDYDSDAIQGSLSARHFSQDGNARRRCPAESWELELYYVCRLGFRSRNQHEGSFP